MPAAKKYSSRRRQRRRQTAAETNIFLWNLKNTFTTKLHTKRKSILFRLKKMYNLDSKLTDLTSWNYIIGHKGGLSDIT